MKICPYLGLQQDSKTPAIFPTERNYCYRANPARPIPDTHQQEYCLSDSYPSCPIFLNPSAAVDSESSPHDGTREQRQRIFPFVVAFLGLLSVALVVWNYRDFLFGPAIITPLPSPLPVITITPLLSEDLTPTEPTPLATNLVIPTLTLSPTDTLPPPTEIASVTPPPGLGTPIGAQPALLVHQVSAGDSLTSLAERYGTTETAIRSVNLMLPVPLWENWLVVVPYQTDQVNDLPLFEVYQVNVNGVTVAALAQQLTVDASLLAQYNNLEEDDFFANGQWALVPHTRR